MAMDTECVHDETESAMAGNLLCDSEHSTKDLFIQNLALFYMKLQAKYLIPVSTVEMIIKDFEEVHTIALTHIKSTVCSLLKQHMSEEDCQHVLQEMDDSDLLNSCNTRMFSSSCKRETFFKKNFQYVAPKKYSLELISKERSVTVSTFQFYRH